MRCPLDARTGDGAMSQATNANYPAGTTTGGPFCPKCGQTTPYWMAHICPMDAYVRPTSTLIVTQPNLGWQCPKCSRCFAPWMPKCDHCAAPNEATPATPPAPSPQ